jgi:hydrogenase maturation protein HypF
MHSYHIHINGLVQGVGFRPFVCRIASRLQLNGWVSNSNNGVHIEFNAMESSAALCYHTILNDPPPNAIITHHSIERIPLKSFIGFSIKESNNEDKPDLLLTPDIALCTDCKTEILSLSNKRFQYPFTTCLQCGPRYSIITALPYDRVNTTMRNLQMCPDCNAEYNDITNRRHYSQTNSCKDCAIPMHLFDAANHCICNNGDQIPDKIITSLKEGNIVAVKGIGGYLLLCDATNEMAIHSLRVRKHRAAKPLALLYADIAMVQQDMQLRSFEISALEDKSAPIVLCCLKEGATNSICRDAIAPGLDKIGLMLAYTPLLFLIATSFGKPLVATSGNISGSPILYKDDDALENLFEVADLVLTYDRDIVAPQDDSVIQFTNSGQKIILRRSRGLAPNYFPSPFNKMNDVVLAMGGELKAAFALQDQHKLYVSQFLGDQSTLESQTCFKETLSHLTKLVSANPRYILVDKHPNYFVSQYGKLIADARDNFLLAIQHHKAHFGAVLAENNLLESNQRILGIIWDGTGYGDDGQIWGGEIFIYEQHQMERAVHLDYFPQLLGDKMSKEPRLSALSLLKNLPQHQYLVQDYFSKQEWSYYQQLLQQPAVLLTSSMGRFLDGIAAILGIRSHNNYEGEAAMQLEALARNCTNNSGEFYRIQLSSDRLEWAGFLKELLEDCRQKIEVAIIAQKVFYSLAKMVQQVSHYFKIDQLAFSGGVFQNALLIDMLIDLLTSEKQLYFHQQLSPNDESIGFGQLACFSMLHQSKNEIISAADTMASQQFQLNN